MDTNDLTLKDLFESSGWQAVNRMGALAEMHHIFLQNFIELNDLILKFNNIINPSKALFLDVDRNITRYIFNFFAATSGLTDNCRKMMNYYKGSNLWNKYDEKINESFKDNLLVSFVKDFRNYQAHIRINSPIFPAYVNECDIEYKIVYFTEDFLKYPNEWKSQSKEYMKQCGEEINVLKVCQEYFSIVDAFYFWLYNELTIYHKEDLLEKDRMCEKLGLPFHKI